MELSIHGKILFIFFLHKKEKDNKIIKFSFFCELSCWFCQSVLNRTLCLILYHLFFIYSVLTMQYLKEHLYNLYCLSQILSFFTLVDTFRDSKIFLCFIFDFVFFEGWTVSEEYQRKRKNGKLLSQTTATTWTFHFCQSISYQHQ